MATVYIDITNFILARGRTGIQRVIKEIVPRISSQLNCKLISEINQNEFAIISEAEFKSGTAKSYWNSSEGEHSICISDLKAGDFFFDIDASWHNQIDRNTLFSNLKDIGVRILKLHYDSIPVDFPHLCPSASVEKYLKHLCAHLDYSSHFFCISKDVKERLNVISNKTINSPVSSSVIALGSFSDNTNANLSKRLNAVFSNSPNKVFLTVGTLEPRKRHQSIIDEFEKHLTQSPENNTGDKLLIIGKKGWGTEELIYCLQNHPLLNKNIFWIEDATDEELEYAYRHSTASIYISEYEGFGLPVIESVTKGLPCITTETSTQSEAALKKSLIIKSPSKLCSTLNKKGFQKPTSPDIPSWNSTSLHIAEKIKSLSLKEAILKVPAKQIFYITNKPKKLAQSLAYISTHMSWIKEAVIVTPLKCKNEIEKLEFKKLTVLTDEELLGKKLEEFKKLKHQQKNSLLRKLTIESKYLDESFIMSDDDSRPLTDINKDYFIKDGSYIGYYYYDLKNWKPSYPTPSSYDTGQIETYKILKESSLPHLSFSSHAPQIINKSLYLEAYNYLKLEESSLNYDEWSVYFNYCLFFYPDKFIAKPYKTLCWPASASDWQMEYIPKEYLFENYYPHLYEKGGQFANFSSEENIDSQIKEKIKIKDKEYKDAKRNAEYIKLSNYISNHLDPKPITLSTKDITVSINKYPKVIFSGTQKLIKLDLEITSTIKSKDINSLELFCEYYNQDKNYTGAKGGYFNISELSNPQTKYVRFEEFTYDQRGLFYLLFNLRVNNTPVYKIGEGKELEERCMYLLLV